MKTLMLAALRLYRTFLSPLLPGSCRFAPNCSQFSEQALERHGTFRGLLLTVGRLSRCHPFHPGGYDPVPEKAVTGYRRQPPTAPAKQKLSKFKAMIHYGGNDGVADESFADAPLHRHTDTHDRTDVFHVRSSKP